MHASEDAYALIKAFEGLRLRSYKDSSGIWTVGWGSTRNVSSKTVIDTNEATLRLLDDVAVAEKAVNRLVKVHLKQSQFDALVSFVFNLGSGALEKSTLLKLLNAGKPGVGPQFIRWKHDVINGKPIVQDGLVRRRISERRLFETGVLLIEP
jgi:lysozyme